jgi:Raf kinase inhibitor-like YbhB/YbcL family protein
VKLRRRAIALLVAPLMATMLASCGGSDEVGVSGPPPPAPAGIALSSSAFTPNAEIPERYSCDGDQTSPPLEWSGVPKGAKELALLFEDPDAPSGTFVHWTVYGISPTTTRIAEGTTPPGSKQGANSFGDTRYGGPCPAEGDEPHHYVFTLYALRSRLDIEAGAAPDDVRAAITKAALARGQLVGRFARK